MKKQQKMKEKQKKHIRKKTKKIKGNQGKTNNNIKIKEKQKKHNEKHGKTRKSKCLGCFCTVYSALCTLHCVLCCLISWATHGLPADRAPVHLQLCSSCARAL